MNKDAIKTGFVIAGVWFTLVSIVNLALTSTGMKMSYGCYLHLASIVTYQLTIVLVVVYLVLRLVFILAKITVDSIVEVNREVTVERDIVATLKEAPEKQVFIVENKPDRESKLYRIKSNTLEVEELNPKDNIGYNAILEAGSKRVAKNLGTSEADVKEKLKRSNKTLYVLMIEQEDMSKLNETYENLSSKVKMYSKDSRFIILAVSYKQIELT